MIDIFNFEGKKVKIVCCDGRIMSGIVNWCSPAVDNEENEDILSINGIGLFVSEIKKIEVED